MRRFLKLSNFAINVSAISHIEIKKNSYKIYTKSLEYSGFHFTGSGFVSTDNKYFFYDKNDNATDHQIITDFIENERTDR